MADKRLIPDGIRDENTEALNELIGRIDNLDLSPLNIYDIDNVEPSALLHLATQFHVMGLEGWSLAETEQEKRGIIKNALLLHKRKGTPWSIRNVFEILNINAELQEWFEYGGQPFFFKILLYSLIDDDILYYKFSGLINEYKRESARLEVITLPRYADGNFYTGSALRISKQYKIKSRGWVMIIYPVDQAVNGDGNTIVNEFPAKGFNSIQPIFMNSDGTIYSGTNFVTISVYATDETGGNPANFIGWILKGVTHLDVNTTSNMINIEEYYTHFKITLTNIVDGKVTVNYRF